MYESELTRKIIHQAIAVHHALGPGLLESAYKECLYYNLYESGLFTEKEKAIPLIYKQVKLDCGYRIDLLVENKIVIEIKSVEQLNEVHLAQTLTYMKLGNFKVGLLLNFNVARLKDGLKMIINDRCPPSLREFPPLSPWLTLYKHKAAKFRSMPLLLSFNVVGIKDGLKKPSVSP
ncbi:MAG: GxxExxY protein [Sphingobacteriales bacterium]|nr:MAG: GxxExxY protein [Sphingobacteriales bacterium]